MKRLVAGVVAVGLLGMMVLVTPKPAEAGGRFWGGFGVGAVTGLVVGGIFAPRVYAGPPVVYYQPAPVYGAPAPSVVYQPVPVYAAPACSSYWVNGYWYGPSWVAGHWEQVCP